MSTTITTPDIGKNDIITDAKNNENAEAVEKNNPNEQFTLLLNGQSDLEGQLQEFRKACNVYNMHRRKRCRKRYYNLSLMAKIVPQTTVDELKRLLKNGTRTLLIDGVTNKREDVFTMVKMMRAIIAETQSDDKSIQQIIGFALEITGDSCRVSRLRNNCSVFLQCGSIITLTTNIAYKYSGFKEIMYIINLKYYLTAIKLNDIIKIGREVSGKVVKKLRTNIALLIEQAGIINSYEFIELPNQCYSIRLDIMPDIFKIDLNLAASVNADFIVVPRIRCLSFLKVLQNFVRESGHKFKLIGAIDLEFSSAKMLDIMGIIKVLDFLWLPNLFNISQYMHTYICQDVIPLAKCLKKPIIGTIPLECCTDFKVFENHQFLWQIDCMFIEKSQWCNKYPLIVKKLLPIRDFRIGVVENTMALKEIISSYQSVVNFIIRTISTIECQAIFLHSKCETAATALSRVEIYCPVYVILPLDEVDADNEEDLNCRIQLIKVLNLRRNLRALLYTKEMNECEYKPIEYGVEYARRAGCINTGDFIITLEVGKEGGDDNIQLGVGEDVVIMKAFYLPPEKIGDKYRCN